MTPWPGLTPQATRRAIERDTHPSPGQESTSVVMLQVSRSGCLTEVRWRRTHYAIATVSALLFYPSDAYQGGYAHAMNYL